MLRAFVVFGFCFSFLKAQEVSSDGCFNIYRTSQVMCLQPFEICPNVQSADECRNLCKTKPGCTGVQYQTSTKECSLYNKPLDGIGAKAPIGRPKPTLRFKRLTCYGSQPTLNRNAPDYEYSQLIGTSCSNQGGVTTTITSITAAPVLPEKATCPAGKTSVLYLYHGDIPSAVSTKKFSGTTADACGAACLANKLPDGTFAPCVWADFNAQSNVCQIFADSSPPLVPTSSSDPNSIHYEKICLDSNLAKLCPGPILIAPEKALVGMVESVLTTASRDACIAECYNVNSNSRFGFVCASGMFYSSEPSNNCVLNSASFTTQPTLFIDQTGTDKVDYFEPMCSPSASLSQKSGRRKRQTSETLPDPIRRRNVIWPNRSNFGSWTRCDAKASRRFHYKNCKSFNPNKCEVEGESCNPTQRDKEMEEIMKEELEGSTVAPFLRSKERLADKTDKKSKKGKEKAKGQEKGKEKKKP